MKYLCRFFFLAGICAALLMLPHESCSCEDDGEDNDNPSIDDDGNDDASCEDHPMCNDLSTGWYCVDNMLIFCQPGADGCSILNNATNCDDSLEIPGGQVCEDGECVDPDDDDDVDDDCEDNPLCPERFGWICLDSWSVFCQPAPDGCMDIVIATDCGEEGKVCVEGNCEDTLPE